MVEQNKENVWKAGWCPQEFGLNINDCQRLSLTWGLHCTLRTMSWSNQHPSANGSGWSSRRNTSWPCNVCHTINTVTGKQTSQHMVQVQTYLLEATSVAIKTTSRHWSLNQTFQNGLRPHLSSGRNPVLDAENLLLLWMIKNMVRVGQQNMMSDEIRYHAASLAVMPRRDGQVRQFNSCQSVAAKPIGARVDAFRK